MGRVFCLPVFSRRHKVKLESKAGNPEEISNGTPASPASAGTRSFSEPQVVARDPVHAASGEASSSSCYEEHHGQVEKMIFPEQREFLKKIMFPELQAGEATSVNDSAVAGAIGDLEAEVIAGHLSDPGLYCVENPDFSESCATSDCSQNNGGRQEFEQEEGVIGEAFVAHEVGEEIKVDKVVLALEDEESTGMKRVAEWVKSIDSLAEPFVEPPLVETPVSSEHHSRLNTAHRELEFANTLIRSLDFNASVAHLNGVGLAVIPPLAAFSHLKTLKLSGNLISRITPGALPRGLHTLDLSRNNIAVIEGLRELTRLRSLNLSHNRIQRIGQGLANCSSIRELHLASNKISEVEGLHRLGKLAFLELSFNRLSSTKSLGQIAATYTSLLAINLAGNPVMVNVGEEQVKRFITGVAPNLVYLNNQAIKGGGSTRDAVVRSLVGGSSSSSRHSPHNSSSSSSKAKRILNASVARPKKDPRFVKQEQDHQQLVNHRDSSSSLSRSSRNASKPDLHTFEVQERLLLSRIQRVKSDGALHDKDV